MTQIETPPADAAAEAKARVDAIGLPVDPAARKEELDRLIAAGETEMRTDINTWQRDPQRRADHKIIIEEQERAADNSAGGLGFYSTASVDEVRAVMSRVDPAIAEMEAMMRSDIRGYQAKENAPVRALYGRLLEIRQISQKRFM